ncbi:MAG: putative methyltransferase, partial [Nocardioidaceae bacterium]|nr:putative methyltransferase [Nocardioidaceae bacterium]
MSTDQITESAAPPIDMDALMAFVGRFVGDLGATMAAGNVMIGERLGLYRALADGPTDARGLATATGTDPRYVEEWLRGQAAGGYVTHDAATATYSMTPEQAFALTDPDGPVFLPGAFELALGALKAQDRIEDAFRHGTGVGWHEH